MSWPKHILPDDPYPGAAPGVPARLRLYLVRAAALPPGLEARLTPLLADGERARLARLRRPDDRAR
ncbi:MAG: hypothetical protein QM617_05370, partial [Comamonas sp.]